MKEVIKKIKTKQYCEWCFSDLGLKVKADYIILFDGGKEYICKGHYDYVRDLKVNFGELTGRKRVYK